MKSFLIQTLILVVLSAVVGTGANFIYGLMGKDSGAYSRQLEWWPRHYAKATTVEGCEARAARQSAAGLGPGAKPPEPPAAAPGSEPEGEPLEGSDPQGSEVAAPAAEPGSDAGTATQPRTGDPGATEPDTPVGGHSEYPMIGIAELIEELEAGTLVIDARRTKAYVAGHVPGAISIPAWEHPGERVNALLEQGAVLEAPTIVYCSKSQDCEDSVIVCGLLNQAGFVDLRIYGGGFPDWKEKQPGAIVTGEEPGEFDPEAVQGDAAE